MPTIRDAIAEFLNPLDGLSAQNDPDGYTALMMPAPLEPDQNRRDVLRQSGCAILGARVVWSRFGCVHPILLSPYRATRAMSDAFVIARDSRALRSPDEDDGPGVGDLVHVADARGEEHVFTPVVFTGASGGIWTLESIDGGQGPHGAGILRRTRSWFKDDRGVWWDIVDAIDGNPYAPRLVRRLTWYADCSADGLGLVVP